MVLCSFLNSMPNSHAIGVSAVLVFNQSFKVFSAFKQTIIIIFIHL